MNGNRGINAYGSNIGPTQAVEEEGGNRSDRDVYQPTRFEGGTPNRSAMGTITVTGIVNDDELRVVGWLVSIYGNCKGKDYHLYTGINFIGRGLSGPGRVNLTDNRIHGAGELIVSYDPVNNKYTVKPTEGGNCLAYLNENIYIDEKMALSPYDCITLRDKNLKNKNEVIAKLMFVPLCGECFTWNDGVVESNG